MTEQSNQAQNPPAGDERPEVYSISQAKDGSFHFSRREIFALGAALGGALVIKGVCPRFAARSGAGEPAQAGMLPLPRVPIHTAPSIASNIAGTLQHDDLVRLVSDDGDLGWVEVATHGGQRGWVERSSVDFSRAIASSSPDFDLDSASSAPTETVPQLTCSVRSSEAASEPKEPLAAGELPWSVQLIRNRSFESGKVEWAEYSTGSIISVVNGTYDGSWAAWFGGDNAQERLTQLFHVPPLVEDAQQLTFYLYVQSIDPGPGSDDVFRMRFLNAAGNPFPDTELLLASNLDAATYWYQFTIDLTGMRGVADQDIRLQFECINDSTNSTSFYLDLVSLNVTYGAYVYLPLVVRQPLATPTPIPCTSYCGSDCPSYCGSDCSSHCSSDYCSSDCPSYCGSYCGWDCSDCYSICDYNWGW